MDFQAMINYDIMEQIESSDEDSVYLTASDDEPDSDTDDILVPSFIWSVERLPVSEEADGIIEPSSIWSDQLVTVPTDADEIITESPVWSIERLPVQTMTGNIEIWKFGSTSSFRTVPVTTDVYDVLSIAASSIYCADRENISLFLPYRIIEPHGKMCDQIIHCVDTPKVFIVQRPESRQPHSMFLTSAQDMINAWDDASRVSMPCGHGITPDNLYDYCMSQMKSGYHLFTCPAIPDPDKIDTCGRQWTFDDVTQRACLSDDERNVFEMMLSYNWLQRQQNVQLCPQCGTFIESECSQNGYCVCRQCTHGGIYKFCVFCLQSWKNAVPYGYCGNGNCNESLQKRREILNNCPNKVIVDVPNCPTVRACPNCNYLVQHDGDVCKHMDCPSINCNTKFCFICLKVKQDGDEYWPCGGAFERCNPAERQNI